MARVSITDIVHRYLDSVIVPGDMVIDATVGNGHDALFLAGLIGGAGKLYGFDIQPDAITTTEARLEAAGMLSRADLSLRRHEQMATSIPKHLHGHISAVVYNLGYLPGSDKTLTTKPDATIASLKQACDLLRSGGTISLLAYTGHPGGMGECNAIKGWAADLNSELFRVKTTNLLPDHHHPPEWIWIEKRGF